MFFSSLGRSGAWKTFPFFKKTNKTVKGKECWVFCGVGINTDEGVLGISETAVDLQEVEGREVLTTAEKKENLREILPQ